MSKAATSLWIAGSVVAGLALALLAGVPSQAQSCAFDEKPTTYEGPQNRSLYLQAQDLAAYNMLTPGDPFFGLPPVEQGVRGNRSVSPAGTAPPVLLKSLGWIESVLTQADGEVPYEAIGPALVSFDCGHGIMQVTSGMTSPAGESGNPSPEQALVATHYAYNVARGAFILVDKWNQAPEQRPVAGTDTNGDPAILENWYFAVWSYNGFTGPGANRSNHPLDPIYGPWPRLPFSCGQEGDGFGHNRGNYPYQELVFGCASRPPVVNGVRLWTPQPIDLPNLNDTRWSTPLALSNFTYPYSKMDIPTARPAAGGVSFAPTATLTTGTATPFGGPPTTGTPTATPTAPATATATAPSLASPTPFGGESAQTFVSGVGHVDNTPRPSQSLRDALFGKPTLSVSTSSITLKADPQTGGGSATVTVSNPGTGILTWLAVPSAPWLVVSPEAGIAAGSDLVCATGAPCQRTATFTISIDPNKAPGGTKTATVTVMAPGAKLQKVITISAKVVVRLGAPGITRN